MAVARGPLPVASYRQEGARHRRPSRPSTPVAVAVGTVVAFVALSCWWLMRNRAMPYGDAGFHVVTALEFRDAIANGHLFEPFTWRQDVYPPLTPLVGAFGFLLGGRTPAAPIVAQNLLYVPLLAVACYRIGQRAYGSTAGCLAVVFALGGPLIAEQFHVFMLDAPLTALVAATIWLVLESERFERVPIAAAAGALAGLGLMSKQTFPLYVTGFVVLVLARGGWRNIRGLAAFTAIPIVLAAPWYLAHIGELHQVVQDAATEWNIPPAAQPPVLTGASVAWYFWALANGMLFAPLLAFVAAGVVSTSVAAVRRPQRRGVTIELLGGLLLAYAAITLTRHKDVRYALPLLVYLAVLGTGWIALLRPAVRTIAVTALVLAVAASTMGATFGVGRTHTGLLPGNWGAPGGQGVMPLNRLTLYSNHNYMVGGPRRAGDLLGLFDELHAIGIRYVAVFRDQAPAEEIDYNLNGVRFFVRLANLGFPNESTPAAALHDRLATVIHGLTYGTAPPCVPLPGGGGVWIRLGEASAPGARDYCPRFARRFYGP